MPLTPIPPPITSSVFLPTRSSTTRSPSTLPTQKPWYHRKAANLEADLQILLDAQAAGLSNPLDQPPTPSTSSTSDPLSRSDTSTPVSQARVRRDRKIPLRSARAGLYTTMRRLAALKDEEIAETATVAEGAAASHEQLLHWAERREKLRVRTEEIASGPDVDAAKELRDKAEGMQPEIMELEDRLAKLRNEQRRLRREAEEVQNRVEAKLSGYTRGLEELEREVRDFVGELRPVDGEVLFDGQGAEGEDANVFWQLAPKRRTLEMATEVVGKERERVEGRLELVETEREALVEGATVWKDVVRLVEDFERNLREDMKSIGSEGGSSERLRDTLTTMDETVQHLESQVKLAETKGWKLLIAAIGAELDAFVKGRDVLQQALGVIEGPRYQTLFDGMDDEEQGSNSVIRSPLASRKDDQDSHDGRIEELDHAFAQRQSGDRLHDTDEDDDGPDPELMISHHHDTDTD
ncbi:hypothetical protein C1H76_9160 [Elsinoe australis]|uniref:Autophagy-related protein 28 n=1 Tax=Elsinoe australis TaxID=40998 RepID=A0A4V6DT74_9PEZI|nr:hypothetical protein C1H76_9160 [Elsinoe australis]